MERKPIVETYQPRRPGSEPYQQRTYVPQKPNGGSQPSSKPSASTIVAKPTVNKTK